MIDPLLGGPKSLAEGDLRYHSHGRSASRGTIVGMQWLVPPFALVGLTWATLTVLHVLEVTWSGLPIRDHAWTIGTSNLCAYVWIRTRKQVPLRRQVTAIVSLVLAQCALSIPFRIDGFMGDNRPRVIWRWQPHATRVWEPRSGQRVEQQRVPSMKHITTQDYPGFRGRDRTGVVESAAVEWDWNLYPPRELWRMRVGVGWSSFAIADNRCFTQEQRNEWECTTCYDLPTGREIWVHRDLTQFSEVTGGIGPRATPTVVGNRLYALGATGILNCLDVSTGSLFWSRDILADHQTDNCIFGMSGSPLLIDNLVIVSPGGTEKLVAAYDFQTGEPRWAGGSAQASYSSPHDATIAGQRQVVLFHGDGLSGHSLSTGETQWSIPWVSNPSEKNNVCQPIVLASHENSSTRIFIASGYGQGCGLFQLARHADQFTVDPIWRNRSLRAKFSSAILYEQHVYGLDERYLVCIDLATGDRVWRGGRYGYGQLLRVGGHLVVQAESGKIALVRATPDRFEEIGQIAEALPSRTWNHPAFAEPVLLVRNDREAACYELQVQHE